MPWFTAASSVELALLRIRINITDTRYNCTGVRDGRFPSLRWDRSVIKHLVGKYMPAGTKFAKEGLSRVDKSLVLGVYQPIVQATRRKNMTEAREVEVSVHQDRIVVRVNKVEGRKADEANTIADVTGDKSKPDSSRTKVGGSRKGSDL